ncbi:MAG TPA: outer membrane beta-barrel protein [Terriglobales bacterium]|nr:outer membrane beta-barrel protein [Terriglobales bacterium]
MRKFIAVLGFACLVVTMSVAQTEYPKVELAGGYSYVNFHPNLAPLTSQNMNGGGGAFVYNFSPIFGIKADFMGYAVGTGWTRLLQQQGLNVGASASGNMFTYMFGPQIKKHSGKFQPFGEALFGAAHSNGYATLVQCIQNQGCSGVSGNSSNNAFAMEFGGGLDYALSEHVQIRPLEVDYLMTRFGYKSYSASQNNFKYFAGVNFTFGGSK